MGVPSIAFGIAANQLRVLQGLFDAGCAAGEAALPEPDVERIAPWIDFALADVQKMRGMAAKASELVDGQGARRVADALLTVPIRFRPATLRDAADLLRWRNHPRVRAASRDHGEIDLPRHTAWLQEVLTDPARVLLIAECGEHPVGVVRFDFEDRGALISVYRTPGTPGR